MTSPEAASSPAAGPSSGPGGHQAPRPEVGPQTRWVDAWQPGPVLDTLRRLLDSGRRATPALARRAGLTHTELAVLEHLMEDPAGPSELAQRLGVTTAAASGIVDRLVSRGHAQRQPHPTDRRRTAVVATPSGREELMGHLMPMFAELAQVEAALTDAEREVVLRFLTDADRAVGRLL
ncbi:MarR family winged helix-turn-helix transcriptional regulator [Serinicoccus chungangensis]|uniref:MarR family winged helix-turn-helix transcriptional regulator n=1 Tax=Serinicoccus chungangensis TaxID=767452 RepID=UPI001118910F|nr:MarR family winged helix-turn-helix transcriptional regulator [Serinicoccus chungangensis]